MKLTSISAARLAGLALVFLFVGALAARVQAGELKLEALLIWGTNDETSPDPKHKPVGPNIEKKLKSQPFKWKNYFECKRQDISVGEGETRKVTMSKECDLQVKNLGKQQVEVTLIGKGKSTGTVKQGLPKHELLVLGGNAANATSWFIVLRQKE